MIDARSVFRVIALMLMTSAASFAAPATAATKPTRSTSARAMIAGADLSMLPEIEKRGGTFRRADGSPADAIDLLREHRCNLIRLRLFVAPSSDFDKTWGATQDLNCVRALAKRAKAAGVPYLLDLHYSDTWADPQHQTKPRAWEKMSFDALEKQVHDYTADVLKDLANAGASPDMVQIGNEIGVGMLWPDARVPHAAPGDDESLQWKHLARLLSAGASAVREAQTDSHPIQIMIHIEGGGRAGMPKWFFDHLNHHNIDFDVIGLSFYPAWGDSIDVLKQNIHDLIGAWHKDVILAETSYPWKEMTGVIDVHQMRWPMTPHGQKQFVDELIGLVRDAPEGRGRGFIWWYPEAIPIRNHSIWRGGAEALFDQDGKSLPAMDSFRSVSR